MNIYSILYIFYYGNTQGVLNVTYGLFQIADIAETKQEEKLYRKKKDCSDSRRHLNRLETGFSGLIHLCKKTHVMAFCMLFFSSHP